MDQKIAQIVDFKKYDLNSKSFRKHCKETLDRAGALSFEGFLLPEIVESIRKQGEDNMHLAYYTSSDHNIYLSPKDHSYPDNHIRNRTVISSKGCITTDQIPSGSDLHALYDSEVFRSFLCDVLGVKALYEYADALSSINVHYASEGQQLGWHYDNSSFAITLMIQSPKGGGQFEYVKDVRDADGGEMNFELSEKILDNEIKPDTLNAKPGTLTLFRGRNSIHRVTPTVGDRTRMLVVLAYNTEPNKSLSESARMTFYGRLA
ncbi:2OG-Fe(II) oxygenase [Flagellimonas sp. GZD32]|uniref:2OG-Fe(II) oxygenase n=1 Tax=Flagellimonas cixiensis TaxID=3228750 RepID=UPI0035C8A0C5